MADEEQTQQPVESIGQEDDPTISPEERKRIHTAVGAIALSIIAFGGIATWKFINRESPAPLSFNIADSYTHKARILKSRTILLQGEDEKRMITASESASYAVQVLDATGGTALREAFEITRIATGMSTREQRNELLQNIASKVAKAYETHQWSSVGSGTNFETTVNILTYCAMNSTTAGARDTVLQLLDNVYSQEPTQEISDKNDRTAFQKGAVRGMMTRYRTIDDLTGWETPETTMISTDRASVILQRMPAIGDYQSQLLHQNVPDPVVRVEAGLWLRISRGARHEELRYHGRTEELSRRADRLGAIAYQRLAFTHATDREEQQFYEELSELLGAGLPTKAIQLLTAEEGAHWW